MKKIFTLIAIAAMAISANAQGSYGLQGEEGVTGDPITAGTKVTSVENIVMTFGDTGAAEFKGPKYNTNLNDILGATAFTEGNGVNGNKENGTIYYFEPAKDGVLFVGAVINADKTIIVKKDNKDGENVAFKVFDNDGTTEVTVNDGGTVDAKTYGIIKLNVTAGQKYAVGIAGSKMGYYGFKFELGGTAGLNAIKTTENTNDAVIYNLAGQKVANNYKGLVIKNGKKVVMK